MGFLHLHYFSEYLCSNVHLQISTSDLQCLTQGVQIQGPAPLLLLSDPTAVTRHKQEGYPRPNAVEHIANKAYV